MIGVRGGLVGGGYVLDEDRLEDAVPVGDQPPVLPVAPGAERGGEDGGLPACLEVQVRLDGRLAGGDVVGDACFVLSTGLAEGPDVVLVVGGGHQRPVQPGQAWRRGVRQERVAAFAGVQLDHHALAGHGVACAPAGGGRAVVAV